MVMNSLSSKIALGYLLLIILTLSIAVFSLYQIHDLNSSIIISLKDKHQNITIANELENSVSQQDLVQFKMVENRFDGLSKKSFLSLKDSIINRIQDAYFLISFSEELVVLDSVKLVYNQYLKLSDSLQHMLANDGSYMETKSYHLTAILPITNKLVSLCQKLEDVNTKFINQSIQKSESKYSKAFIFISLFSIIAILISILTGIYLTKKIIQPVKKTADSVRKISRGQFDHKIPISTNDEIAELGIEFNSMTYRINEYIKNVSGLKELDKIKSQFMANISHEFKTPLTSINMALDILLKEIKGNLNKDQTEILKDAKDDLNRLTDFARDILTLAKLESGTKDLKWQKSKINTLFDYSQKPLRFKTKEKNIQIQTEIIPSTLGIFADFKLLSGLITNLLDNAIRYSSEGDIIKMSARSKGDHILFCISDSGCGIPKHSLEHIFDKYAQLEANSSVDKSNIGLGLAIAKEIIELHNGEIWVESQESIGSQFYFRIPHKGQNEN